MVGIQSYISKAKKDLGYSDIDTGSSSTKKEKKFKNRDGKDFVPTRKKVSMGKITKMKSGGKASSKNKKEDNPSGSPLGKYSLLNKVIKGVDSITGYDRSKNKTKKKAEGGSLKSVPADNKGLGKLPTPVRNKMGYMKNGGVVKMRGGGAATRGMNFNRGY